MADFAAQHAQFRFTVAPPPFSYPAGPEYQPMIRVGWTGFPDTNNLAWGNPFDGRWPDGPQWSDTWWDETTAGSDGGPAVFGGFDYIFEPGGIAQAQYDGYLFIMTPSGASGGYAIRLSQLVGQITWVLILYEEIPLRLLQRDDGLAMGGHPRLSVPSHGKAGVGNTIRLPGLGNTYF